MVAIGKKEEMAQVETKKPTISDGDSATDSDSENSDLPDLVENTGLAPGAGVREDKDITAGGVSDYSDF